MAENKHSSSILIYTDGSCQPNPGKGGYAFIILLGNDEISGKGYSMSTTNNIMEMSGVMEALKFMDSNHKINSNKLKIFSDSMYVINCAQRLWKRSKNIELWKEFDKLTEGKDIEWVWVRGHNGDEYNEKVDKLAKSAIKK